MRHLEVTDSDIIKSVAYGDAGELEVVFKSSPDTVYTYEKVSTTQFCALVSAKSIGSHFSEHFKKTKWPFVKSDRAPTLKK